MRDAFLMVAKIVFLPPIIVSGVAAFGILILRTVDPAICFLGCSPSAE
jgi:hypothetical protein